jgi:nucleoside-diphosphate-sugar epimerase
MRIVLGSDGYLGFPLVLRLLAMGHEVVGIDNLSRRRIVREWLIDQGVDVS